MQIGIDLGGTKTEAIALDADTLVTVRRRIATPRDYAGTLDAITRLVAEIEGETGQSGTVGVGIPGVVSHSTGLVKNANSTWLIGRPLLADLEARLSRPVRVANDANCFTLSEAIDGAGRGFETVFGVILGTGVGGGIAIRQRIHDGPNQIAGEWGHNPLPWMTDEERAVAPRCYCGKSGCIETFLSGPGFELDYARLSGAQRSSQDIVRAGGRRRTPRTPGSAPVRGPPRPRPGYRHQRAGPRRHRPRRRNVQPARSAVGGLRPVAPLRLFRHRSDQGPPQRPRRLERRPRRGLALALTPRNPGVCPSVTSPCQTSS